MRINFLSSLLLITTIPAFAQLGAPQVVTIADRAADHMASADMDNDGDNDIITSSGGGGDRLLICENIDGNGHFSYRMIFDQPNIGNMISWHQLVDVDADGLIDIVVGRSSNYPFVQWWHNVGNMNFDGPSPFPIASLTDNRMLFIDVNMDGAIDVIYGTYNLSFNLGGGQFDAPIPLFTSFVLLQYELISFDCDGDGDDDIAQKDEIAMHIWRNDGAGVFTETATLPYMYTCKARDIDGDGMDDLFAISHWYKSLGNGSFSAPIDLPEFQMDVDLDLIDINIIDINNDGYLDIISMTQETIDVLFATGFGTFTTTTNLITSGFGFYGLLLSDMTGDGVEEVIANHREHILQYAIPGNGTLIFQGTINESFYQSSYNTMATADVNGDGLRDILRLSQEEGLFYVYLNNGPQGFGQPKMLFHFESICSNFVMVDFDNDGDQDIMLISGNHLGTYLNQGNLSFTPSVSCNSLYLDGATIRALADLDGDSDLDFLTWYSGRLYRWRYDGISNSNAWTQLSSIPSLYFPDEGSKFLGLMDVDEDGDLDVLAYEYPNIRWAPNLGGFNFGARQTLVNTISEKIELQDMDLDGDLDIVFLSPAICWSENMGGGQFEPPLVSILAAAYSTYHTLDVDHDGYRDVVGLVQGQPACWYKNNGDGTWALPNYLGVGQDFDFLGPIPGAVVSDLDGDGDEDLLYPSNQPRDGLKWMANYGSDPYHLTGTVFADLNGNGTMDSGDSGLPGALITASPAGYVALGDSAGSYIVYSSADTQSVTATLSQPFWTLSSTPSTYTVEPSIVQPDWPNLDFGFMPTADTSLIEPVMVLSPASCGNVTSLWLSISNQGTRVEHGTITLNLDPVFAFQGSNPSPLSITGNEITWEYDTLEYFAMQEVQVQVTMPAASHFGEAYTNTLTVTTQNDQSQETGSFITVLQNAVTCAYDPNDKLVDPEGYGAYHAVSINTDELEYTIRFQNTGNDTATTIELRDFLDTAIQPASFHIMGASHAPSSMGIEPSGELVVRFNNIQLVDSGTSFTGSQGFIKFRVRLQPGLPNMTQVHNTAHILFDLNPPVNTNTALTTLVDCSLWVPEITSVAANVLEATPGDAYQWSLNGVELDGATGQTLLIEENGTYTVEVTSIYGCTTSSPSYVVIGMGQPELGKPAIALVPNPFNEIAVLMFGEVMTPQDRIQIIDVNGRAVQEMQGNGTNTSTINRHGLSSGLYVVRVLRNGTTNTTTTIRMVVE